jgi:hypothetical protein
VNVRGRWIDSELYAERSPERQLGLEPSLRETVDGVAGQPGSRLGGSLSRTVAVLRLVGIHPAQC